MDYKNNINEQKKLLENHLHDINVVVSALLGIKTNLTIRENKDYKNDICYNLADDTNIRKKCGVMASAFKNVSIKTFGIWWQNDGVLFDLSFYYEHNDGGLNGAKFCTIQITNEILKVL